MRAKHGAQGFKQMIHLLVRVERGGGDAQPFRPARNGRVVDGLDVDPVLDQQVIRDAPDPMGVTNKDWNEVGLGWHHGDPGLLDEFAIE
jgi:hypothetical protein